MAKTKVKKIIGKVFLILLIVVVAVGVITAVVNTALKASNRNYIQKNVNTVEYENQLVPKLDDNDMYCFVSDENFRVMRLTDVHIGGGFMSFGKDKKAIDAVAAMVNAEKPDFVIVTGDIAYPVPFQSGTFNNKTGAVIFADLMEKLGVYWCLCFGNHDTEAYSYYSRKSISQIYENREKYPHCIFRSGPEDVDGYGNYVVNLKKSDGSITKSFFVFDSHSYVDNDYFGALWKYDCVHTNQIQWYRDTLMQLKRANKNVLPKSFAFMHIPPQEVKFAFDEYRDNGFENTQDVKYISGEAGEHKDVVYSGNKNYGLIDAFSTDGSTRAVFFGHDHLNNFSLIYKGIKLSYGYSIDYLAYMGISNYGAQRGCQMITIQPGGSYSISNENYYQEKYQTEKNKDEAKSVSMGSFYSDEESIDMSGAKKEKTE